MPRLAAVGVRVYDSIIGKFTRDGEFLSVDTSIVSAGFSIELCLLISADGAASFAVGVAVEAGLSVIVAFEENSSAPMFATVGCNAALGPGGYVSRTLDSDGSITTGGGFAPGTGGGCSASVGFRIEMW